MVGQDDAPAAPARELAWARAGTTYFARKLDELADDDVRQPSLLPGWDRAALIAHVGYNAHALIRLCEWACTGVETPMYPSKEHRNAEIERGATLPATALRDLFADSASHLEVAWRTLDDAAWDAEVRTGQGKTVPARETAWMRAREVWIHAVDLDTGASFADFPAALLDELISDVQATLARSDENLDLVLSPTDRTGSMAVGPGTGPAISATTADLAHWLTGRGAGRLEASGGELPDLPRWL